MPYLIHTLDHGEQQVIPLNEGVNTIGRHPSNYIVNEHPSLSRYHAQLVVHGSQWLLIDNQSRNGTFVNHQAAHHTLLQDGDVIQCGDIVYQLVLRSPTPPVEEPPVQSEAGLEILTRLQLNTPNAIDELSPPQAGNRELFTVLKLEQQSDPQQKVLDKLKVLLEVSRELLSLDDPSQLLDKILDLLFEILKIDRAAILLVNRETGKLEQHAAKCPNTQRATRGFYSQRIVEFVQKTGDAIISRDAQNDSRFSATESVVEQSIRASMCVPLKPKQTVIGVLYVDSLSLFDIYHEADLQFLAALANQAAVTIENAHLNRTLAEAAVLKGKMERFFPASVLSKVSETDGAVLEIVDTEVSALFADISGFTDLSSRMAPRQVIGMLNEYFEVMVEGIVFPYAGTLEKYIGDALLAIWGAPYQLPDDADRAVYAAITMQHAMRTLNQRWINTRNLQLQIHIGINSGKVAAGNIGSSKLLQYATIGDTTNVASRVCSVAKSGEVVISAATLHRLHNRQIPVVLMPPTYVKGKAEPLELYQVLWQEMQIPPIPVEGAF